jgi:hypothetical protein
MKSNFTKPIVIALTISGAVFAQADVLYDTYAGPNPGFQQNGWQVSTVQFMGQGFSVTGNYTFDSLDIPLGNFNSSTGIYTVKLYTDVAGVPGTLLEAINVNVTTPATVVTSFNLTSALNPLLTTGNYFIVAETTDTNLSGGWAFNNAGNSGSMIFNNGTANGPWNTFSATEMAVRVNGTAVVPEPATFAVLGLGALALIRRRRSVK